MTNWSAGLICEIDTTLVGWSKINCRKVRFVDCWCSKLMVMGFIAALVISCSQKLLGKNWIYILTVTMMTHSPENICLHCLSNLKWRNLHWNIFQPQRYHILCYNTNIYPSSASGKIFHIIISNNVVGDLKRDKILPVEELFWATFETCDWVSLHLAAIKRMLIHSKTWSNQKQLKDLVTSYSSE